MSVNIQVARGRLRARNNLSYDHIRIAGTPGNATSVRCVTCGRVMTKQIKLASPLDDPASGLD